MDIIEGKINNDTSRDLYWSNTIFKSNNNTKESRILICFSHEYISYKPDSHNKNIQDLFRSVIKEWSNLKDEIFKHDVHYSVYATTPEGEASCLDFLMDKARA